MSSQINPNSINQNYPVAGVDNNSQGFRDNFASIKTNFTITQRELDDLMIKVLVKAPLTYGPTPTSVNNTLGGAVISDVVLKDVGFTTVSQGTKSDSGTVTLDFSQGNYHTITLSGASALTTLAFANWPSAGTWAQLRLRVTVSNITHSLALTSDSTYSGGKNISGYDAVGVNTIRWAQTGVYEFCFSTLDAGTNINVEQVFSSVTQPLTTAAAITSNVVIATNTFSQVTGLSVAAQPNKLYKLSAHIPHELNTTNVVAFALNFSSGNCVYMNEQQGDVSGSYVATITTNNSNVNQQTISVANAVVSCRMTGTYSHTGNNAVSLNVVALTEAGNLTVKPGAFLTLEQLCDI